MKHLSLLLALSLLAISPAAASVYWSPAPPSSTLSGQSYSLGATQTVYPASVAEVRIFKNGANVAYDGNGGSGTITVSTSTWSTDSGPQTVYWRAEGYAYGMQTWYTPESSTTATTSVQMNYAPSASLSGSTDLTPNQTGTWNFSVSDSNGNLKRWRFYASTNPNPQWSNISGSSASGSYSTSFPSDGDRTWCLDVEDTYGLSSSTSLTVHVRTYYTLSTSVSPSGAGSVSGGGTYQNGATATPQAFPSSCYRFDHWSGDAGGTSNPTSVTMTSNKSVTAVFVPIQYTLSTYVSPSGAGGVSGDGTYDCGSTANPYASANAGYSFDHWSGDASGTSNPTSVAMTSNKSVTANFVAVPFTLTVDGGSGSGSYTDGTSVPIVAAPPAGYSFTSWTHVSGPGWIANPNAASTTFTMGTGNATVRANFTPILYTLTAQNGTGSGNYASGTVRSIGATPPAGHHFTVWTLTSGPGSIANANSASTTFTMGDGNATVTAGYANDPPIGWLDNITPNPIAPNQTLTGTGWAADFETGAPVHHVSIRIDGNVVVANATLGGSRPDVASSFGRPDYTNSGYSFSYNIGALASGEHTADAVAYDSLGASAVLSGPRTFTVSGPPSIGTHPQSQAASVGASVTFTVVAGGTAPLSYQWKKNDVVISGATSSGYTIASVQATDAGSYTVTVTNPYGSAASNPATLTVNTPPVITTQPQTQTVAPGGTATFTVVAGGTAPLAYQWKKNGADLAGATTATLSIPNVQASHAGSYTVTVTNALGSVTSAAATLTVGTATDLNVHLPLP